MNEDPMTEHRKRLAIIQAKTTEGKVTNITEQHARVQRATTQRQRQSHHGVWNCQAGPVVRLSKYSSATG